MIIAKRKYMAGRVEHIEAIKDAYIFFVVQPEGKTPLGRLTARSSRVGYYKECVTQ
jgi:hypothetical protein